MLSGTHLSFNCKKHQIVIIGSSKLASVIRTDASPALRKQSLCPLPVLFRPLSDFSPSISESTLPPSIFHPSVVIFDKDGTLVCFHTMWNSWCEELASRMSAETETDMAENVYELMGYDLDTKKVFKCRKSMYNS